MLNSGPLSDSLLGYTALLATNQPDAFGSDLFYNIYPPHVISGYRNALSDLGAEVSVCSLERAIQKLSNPILDKRLFVVNMCTGFNSLECESAIQAVASLSNIPCFPCRGDIAVITEEKIISKHLARTAGLRAPETYRTLSGLDNGKKYIRKRVNSGDSKGIRVVDRIEIEDPLNDCEYVEPFISGFDIELFCLFDPLIEEYILLGAIVADWGSPDGTERIQSTEMKSSSDAFVGSSVEIPRWIQVSVTEEMICCINKLGVILHNTFLFRIDGRLLPEADINIPIGPDAFVFLEVNALPTMAGDDGWYSPILKEMAGISEEHELQLQKYSSSELALRLILIIWHKYYVQSKSEEGNKPVRATKSPICPLNFPLDE